MRYRVAIAAVSVLVFASCETDTLVLNTFSEPEVVTEVPCPGAETGSLWTAESAPVDVGLAGIWGSSADDVWAVGGVGTIIHWDGQVWTDVTPGLAGGDLLAVHGSGRDDVWAVGRVGIVLHYDGREWTRIASASAKDLVGVRVVAPGEVWIAGNEGVFRFDGAEVVRAADGPPGPINGVWSSGSSDVWFVDDTAFHRYDGARFASQTIEGAGRLAAIWGTAPGQAWAIGHGAQQQPGLGVLSAGQWQFQAAPPRGVFFTLWTQDGARILVGANDTSIFRFSGGGWCREHLGGIGAVNAFFGGPDGEIRVVGAERVAGETRPLLMTRPGP